MVFCIVSVYFLKSRVSKTVFGHDRKYGPPRTRAFEDGSLAPGTPKELAGMVSPVGRGSRNRVRAPVRFNTEPRQGQASDSSGALERG